MLLKQIEHGLVTVALGPEECRLLGRACEAARDGLSDAGGGFRGGGPGRVGTDVYAAGGFGADAAEFLDRLGMM